MRWCGLWVAWMMFWCEAAGGAGSVPVAAEENRPARIEAKRVFVIPIRDDIMPPLTYLVRRGVKEAMEAKADLLILDMETDGGRVDTTEDIIEILGQFDGQTATFVNRKAFSAGAFISVATQSIYMAPQSVIGAAAPILMIPGAGPEGMPETMEAKMTSGIKALVRTTAKKNGHNPEVIEAMIDRTKELKIDGKVLNKEGQILTLDNEEAAAMYGEPPRPLLSAGTVEDVAGLLDKAGFAGAVVTHIQPLGAERFATWINAISPILLIIGAVGLYIEFKTPGFGVPGFIGLTAFTLYFLGSYIAGLAGMEWLAFFVIGIAFIILELFVFPGTVVLGLGGALLMLISVVMAMVDLYPGMPAMPTFRQVQVPLRDLMIAAAGTMVVIAGLSYVLPKTRVYAAMVSSAPSGQRTIVKMKADQATWIGQSGVALTPLRPGGKARFGDEILDVVTEGDGIEKGVRVRITSFSGPTAQVQAEV